MDSLSSIQSLYDTDGLLDILLGVEEYFDNMDLYAYKNWIKGEVVEGPVVSPYWVEITLKFMEGSYPDPVGATILESQGTKVFARRDTEISPIQKPRSLQDMSTTTTSMGMVSKPKEVESDILLYKFQIPRRLVNPESFDEYRLMVSDFNSNPMGEEDDAVIVGQESEQVQAPEQSGESDELDFDELEV